MRLHSYFRSSASYRVRIALALKGLPFETVPVHLVRGGAQNAPAFDAVNPMHLVPALDTGDGVLTQSLAICEWLEETHPEPPLLPRDPAARAYVRAIVAGIACDIHPLNNLRVLQRLKAMGHDQAARDDWYQHWIAVGFAGLEALVARSGRAGAYSLGDAPTLADVFLVPQIANARRLSCDLAPYPTLVAIDARASALSAFAAAAPSAQPDAEG